MKYIITILLGLSLMAASCNKDGNDALKASKAAKYLLSGQESMTWQYIKMFDPYNGGNTIEAEAGNPRYLKLNNDGTFRKYDKLNDNKGKWYLNGTKDAIAFMNEGSSEELRFGHKIKKFTKDELVLSWQGRHGMVDETYKPAKVDN